MFELTLIIIWMYVVGLVNALLAFDNQATFAARRLIWVVLWPLATPLALLMAGVDSFKNWLRRRKYRRTTGIG